MCSIFRKNNQTSMISTTFSRALQYSKPRFVVEKSQLVVGVRFFSSTLEDKQSFTAPYLVNSCGFSLDTAKSLSMKVHFKTTKSPDSVLSLLRSYGFKDGHITRVVAKFPQVLNMNPEKTLKPKLEFFGSIGISSTDLVGFVCVSPFILRPSLENGLIPLYNHVKNVISNDDKVVKIYFKLAMYSVVDVQRSFAPNMAILKELGVNESVMCTILIISTRVMLFMDRHRFEEGINQVCSMGYDPKRAEFADAVQVFFCLCKSTRERKMEIYKRWGWSEDETGFAMKKYPRVLLHSEKKISNTMDFLVNKMGCKSVDIAKYPQIIHFSLEMRIIPRCLVYKLLLLKGLLTKEVSLSTLVKFPAEKFVEKFVTRYEKEVPRLSEIYQGKMSVSELGYTSEDLGGVKLLL